MDCIGQGITLDSIMETFSAENGSGALIKGDWALVRAISRFLRQHQQVMKRLCADRRTTLNLVPVSIHMLIKHCDGSEKRLQQTDCTLTTN